MTKDSKVESNGSHEIPDGGEDRRHPQPPLGGRVKGRDADYIPSYKTVD